MFEITIPAKVSSVEREEISGDVFSIVLEYDSAQIAFPDRAQVSLVNLGSKGFRFIGGTEGVLHFQAFGEPLVQAGNVTRVAIKPL